MMDYNKHYIRVIDGIVIKGFSDAFETPLDTDILINDKGGRHFEIDGEINPPLMDERFCHLFRYDNKYSENNELRRSTDKELQAEYEANYVEPEPTEMELVWQAITDIEIKQMESDLARAGE